MLGVSYVVMGHTEAGSAITDGKKLRVVYGSMVRYVDQPATINRTLNSTNTQSVGSAKYVFEFDAQVDYSAASGYASIADVLAWLAYTTAANNKWKFQQTEDTTIYNVFLSNRNSQPQWLTATHTDTDSMAVFHFVLVQQ